MKKTELHVKKTLAKELNRHINTSNDTLQSHYDLFQVNCLVQN